MNFKLYKQGPLFVFYLSWFLLITLNVNAQSEIVTLNCGDILKAETTVDQKVQEYEIAIESGTILNLTIEPIGSTFNPALVFMDAGGTEFTRLNDNDAGRSEEFANLEISSSNPLLLVGGLQPDFVGTCFDIAGAYCFRPLGQFIGGYTISVGCILPDPNGTVINPGDLTPTLTPKPPFFGVGFPGLAAVDFTHAVKLPLITGIPMAGAITPTGSEILGFTLDANAGDKLDLAVNRLSGNLNLGVVILSADNKVVFYGGLITSESLSTRLTLPSAGQYTIGVFRVDLLPPDTPEATAFQITGALNP